MNKLTETEIIISDESEMLDAAQTVLNSSEGKKKFTLIGDLGAGKTTFTQHFCRLIGVKDEVTSPTFSLVNEYVYSIENEERKFYHLDLYRLKSIEEALDIGIEDYLYDDNYCFIEWPEIIEELLPEDTVQIKITILPDLQRKILLL